MISYSILMTENLDQKIKRANVPNYCYKAYKL